MPIYPNDTTRIIILVAIPIAEATVLDLHVTKPDGSTVVWPATPYPAHSDDALRYDASPGDLIQGRYLIQPYIVTPTWSGLAKTGRFEVYPPWS